MIDITQEAKAWFTPDDDAGDEYLLRYVAPTKVKDFDGDLELLQHIILDWKGVCAGDEPIPCTPENIYLFAQSFGGVKRMRWIIETAFNWMKFVDLSGDTLKNLSAPSGGESTSRRRAANGAKSAN
jgi:hypothetical protein